MELENVSRKLGVAIANLMCVEISVTPVKLVIMLLKTKIILAAKAVSVMLEDPSVLHVLNPRVPASAESMLWGRPVRNLRKTTFSLICTT